MPKTKPLKTSASQYETFQMCPRKWWFAKVLRLKEPQTRAQTFGTVLHNVGERFFKADDQGYDRGTKQPVDLFPEDWLTAWSRYPDKVTGLPVLEGVASSAEGEMIKTLTARALDNGTWARLPGRTVEELFTKPLGKIEGVEVTVTGLADV